MAIYKETVDQFEIKLSVAERCLCCGAEFCCKEWPTWKSPDSSPKDTRKPKDAQTNKQKIRITLNSFIPFAH